MEVEITHIKYVIAITLSVPLIIIYLLSMIMPLRFENIFIENPKFLAVITFYLSLILLIIRELIASMKLRDILTILIILVINLYSYVVGLYFELSHLTFLKHYVIPPSFIYIPCSDISRCDNFAALSISVPLTLESVLLIYGIFGFLKQNGQ